MAIIRNPRKFTDQFGVSVDAFIEAGLLDPVLNADTQLFIDPLLLEQSAHPLIREQATEKFKQRFADVYRLLSVRPRTEVIDAALDKLLQFQEVAGTCLGYTAGGVSGHGMGTAKRSRFMHVASQVEEVGRNDARLIPVLAILENGIGADLISDMTARIIIAELAGITRAFCLAQGVPVEPIDVGDDTFLLPRNPLVNSKKTPIILVPVDILRDLPEVDTWADVVRLTMFNARLRNQVNSYISGIMADEELTAAEKRERAIKELTEADEAVARVGEFLAAVAPKVYDITNDPKTKRVFQRITGIVDTKYPISGGLKVPTTQAEFKELVERVIEQFRFLIEEQAMWRLLYTPQFARLREEVAQSVFFAVADSYCKGYDVHIAVEHNTAGGRTDFLFTKGREFRIVIEIKWSDNNGLRRGYTKQVSDYAKAEEAFHSYYVVLDCDGGSGYSALQAYLDEGHRVANITVKPIDANPKSSPSKPPL